MACPVSSNTSLAGARRSVAVNASFLKALLAVGSLVLIAVLVVSFGVISRTIDVARSQRLERENRALVAGLARGRRMLDAFCYAGGFACHALLAGAASALLLDSSADALAQARRNLSLNGVEERATLREGNAFDGLRELQARGERFSLVVLDPPPFTRRKDAVEAAARGYKEINLRALRLLEPGGVLATFSCSHHVAPALFEDICRQAAGDAAVPTRLLSTLTQSRDHPVLLNVPETRYLTGLLLEVV